MNYRQPHSGAIGRHLRRRRAERGIALLDALLAVFVFALAVTGIATWLGQIADNSNQMAKERLVQHGLTGILAEAKQRPLTEMNFERRDDLLEVTYRTATEPVQLTTTEGETLEDMYVLRVTADYTEGAHQFTRVAEVFIYKPEDEDR